MTNHMSGDVELVLLASADPQVSITLEKTHLKAGETAELKFSRKGSGKFAGKSGSSCAAARNAAGSSVQRQIERLVAEKQKKGELSLSPSVVHLFFETA